MNRTSSYSCRWVAFSLFLRSIVDPFLLYLSTNIGLTMIHRESGVTGQFLVIIPPLPQKSHLNKNEIGFDFEQILSEFVHGKSL